MTEPEIADYAAYVLQNAIEDIERMDIFDLAETRGVELSDEDAESVAWALKGSVVYAHIKSGKDGYHGYYLVKGD